MTIRPASISLLMVRSLSTIAPASLSPSIPDTSKDLRSSGRYSGHTMEAQGRHTDGHKVKRVALPSGKTIEVVYFEPVARPASTEPTQELHVCAECDSQLVYPVHWSEVDRINWEVTLRCPNCEWSHTG